MTYRLRCTARRDRMLRRKAERLARYFEIIAQTFAPSMRIWRRETWLLGRL